MVNYSRFIGEAMVLMYKLSVIDSPSGRSLEKAPRWDLTGIKGCGGGKVVSWLPLFLWYKSIYRRKKYAGGATSSIPASWPPHGIPDFYSKSSGLLSVKERSS